MNKSAQALLLLTVLATAPAWGSTTVDARSGHRQPPPEAIEACRGLAEGAAVTITTPRGDTISATCKTMGSTLAAVPDGPPPGAGRASQDGQTAQEGSSAPDDSPK